MVDEYLAGIVGCEVVALGVKGGIIDVISSGLTYFSKAALSASGNMLKATSRALQGPTSEEKQDQLEKILSNHVFHGAETLKSFLRFVVKKSLEGQDSELKEYTIATEVFGRSDNYDPRIDSLVRVQAARLRSKLEEYYASDGNGDKVLIHLPKGHYVPAFAYFHPDIRKDLPETVAPGKSSLSLDTFTSRREEVMGRLRPGLLFGLVVTSLFLAGLAYRYHIEAKEARQYLVSNRIDLGLINEISPFWGDFLSNRSPLLIAYSNAVFQGNLVDGLKYWVPPESAPPALLPAPMSRSLQNPVTTDVYTGVGEVMGVYFLGSLFWKTGTSFRVERSLLLNWETVKAQNLVFLGGPVENLLLRRLPQEQDFVYRAERVQNGVPNFVVLNRKPRNSEQKSYAPVIEGASQSTVTEDYALISMLRGLDPSRRLLILSGITTLGTQACAEYVTKPEYVRELIKELNTSGPGSKPELPAYYQVLLKVKINDSVPVQTSYVTHHVLE